MIHIKHIIISFLLLTSLCFADKTSNEIQEDINNKNSELDQLIN